MDIKHIALIGAGELGSRHLQSLSKCDFAVAIQVVDPSESSLTLAKKRFDEMPTNLNIKKVEFFKDLASLDSTIDLVIIATNSDVRLAVMKTLLKLKNVASLFLEKVLFQSIQELDEAEVLLQKQDIQAYVNCPKRGFASSKIISEKIKNSSLISYKVLGENWGLGCNAIHFLDTMSVYCGETSYTLSAQGLDQEISKSKRPGFIEFTGELIANFGPKKNLVLKSQKGESVSFHTSIESDRYLFSLDEKLGNLKIFDKLNKSEELIECKTPFQSELTHDFAKRILFGKAVNLPDFLISVKLHRPLLDGLLAAYNKIEGKNESHLRMT